MISSARRTILSVAGIPLRVEVASTPDAWRAGLSVRTARLDEDEGMIFVFPEPRIWSFVPARVPLSIAFVRRGGEVAAIDDLFPGQEAIVAPPEPVRLALEVDHGWFARHGVAVGDRVELVRA